MYLDSQVPLQNQLPLAPHSMVASPTGWYQLSHTYVTVDPNVVDISMDAGLALLGDGGSLQSTTECSVCACTCTCVGDKKI